MIPQSLEEFRALPLRRAITDDSKPYFLTFDGAIDDHARGWQDAMRCN